MSSLWSRLGSNRRQQQLTADPAQQFTRHICPLFIIRSQYTIAYMSKVREYLAYLNERPEFYFSVFTFLNLLNFMDRGIIPGATNEFISFINDDLDTSTPSLYLGLCQSSFIVGFCIASPVFGHLVHYHGPFTLVAWGMSIWVAAVLLSGLAWYSKSYAFLVLARMLSGVGESSLQCAIPPWIATNASPKTVGTWVSVFYTAIPVGTALGYVYSAVMAGSFGWQWAFFVEAFMMVPFLLFVYLKSPQFPLLDHDQSHFPLPHSTTRRPSASKLSLLGGESTKSDDVSFDSVAADSLHKPSPPKVMDEFLVVVGLPVYDAICAGYAAQTGSLIGISTFGSAFLMGMGYFDTEEEASFTFGAAISIAGILGTPLGGYLMDQYCVSTSARVNRDGKHHYNNTKILFLIMFSSLIGTIFMCSVYWIENKALYILVITLACILIFLAMSGANMAVMMAIPLEHRSFGIALCSIAIHLLGDVPSPVITGFLKDSLAPDCIGDDDAVSTSLECRDDEHGLRLTMLIVGLWLWWTVFFYLLATILSYLKVHSFFPSRYRAISVDGSSLLEIDEEDVAISRAISEVEKYALYPGDDPR